MNPPNAISIEDLLARCQSARAEGRIYDAEAQCRRGLAQLPAQAGLLFENASNAYATGGMTSARDRFRRAAVVLPGVAAIHFNVGVCERAAGRFTQAHRAFQKALLLDPSAMGALDGSSHCQVALGDSAGAFVTAARLMCIDPTSPKVLASFGFVAWKCDRTDIALWALKKSLVLNPSGREADMNVANVLLRLDYHRSAINRYRRLARLLPGDPDAWLNLGVAAITAGDWLGASDAYARLTRINRGRPGNQASLDPYPELPTDPTTPASRRTAWHALEFETQQLRYLLERNALPKEFENELQAYQAIIQDLDEERRRAVAFDLSDTEMSSISRYRGRLTHVAGTGWKAEAAGSNRDARPALNPGVDWGGAEATYVDAYPAITVVDNFLDPMALTALRRFCLESTIWFELKGAGYLGAYFRDGFNDPLLLAIAEELTERMPTVFQNRPLRMIWAYTYEQTMVGINPHADFARINVNFWITPDEANLDPETGGLLIYRRPAPESWGFEQYNGAPGEEIMNFLGDDARAPIRVPHRQNRAVIFDSRLFHETDRLNFRPGIENRRINITMLFGEH